jgi:ADP-heptose:LPS heptosyltransferase
MDHTPEETAARARAACERIITRYHEHREYLRDEVALLCEIAASEDEGTASIGLRALFPGLIERLNDSFDPAACALYDRVFAQVIDTFRHMPGASEFDTALRSFGLHSEADLLERKSRISDFKSQISNSKFQKVLLLSRVTIGADVAVTSVLIAKLREVFPEVEFVVLGSPKLRELFGGDDRIRIREIAYGRGAGVLPRLLSWLNVLSAVREEGDDCLILDPDSRLTQLGLLPLVAADRNYHFFESRGFRAASEPGCLGELASQWMDEIVETKKPAFPFVALPEEYLAFGRRLPKTKHRIAISFGVGGNEAKRVSDAFESGLVERLLGHASVILDKGASAEEHAQVDRIVASLRARGHSVIELDEANKSAMTLSPANVITWDGGIGSFAGFVASSDAYIGYDSAGQHIAAALRIPTLTVFVHSNTRAFAERWRPFGSGTIEVLTLESSQPMNDVSIIEDVEKLLEKME